MLHDSGVGCVLDKEAWRKLLGPRPSGIILVARKQLRANLRDAEHDSRAVRRFDPIPEAATEVEPVVQILRLHEYVSVDQVCISQVAPRSGQAS